MPQRTSGDGAWAAPKRKRGNPGSTGNRGENFFSTDSLHLLKRFERMRSGAGRSSHMLHDGLSGADRRAKADAKHIVPIAASIFS